MAPAGQALNIIFCKMGFSHGDPLFNKTAAPGQLPNAAVEIDDRLSILEGEVNAGASHAEVVIAAIDNVPAEIRYPANVRRDANFEAATKLPHPPGFLVFTDGLRDTKSVMGAIVVAAKDSTTARPDIRRKTGARNRVTQGQCPEHSTDSMAIAAF